MPRRRAYSESEDEDDSDESEAINSNNDVEVAEVKKRYFGLSPRNYIYRLILALEILVFIQTIFTSSNT